MPFLNTGVDVLDSKQLGGIIGVMLLLFSVAKTFIPMQLPWDNSGYDALWFVTLYLTGAYIRKYGAGRLGGRAVSLAVYILSALAIFMSFVVIRIVYLKTGKLGDFISYGYSYNYLFCYIGAVGLFLLFGGFGTKSLERIRKPIELFSSTTFGVYLIHEHVNIRYLWQSWFGCDKVVGTQLPVFLLHMTGTVIVVYIVCSVIEIIRQQIWGLFKGFNKR
jgi:hypothetical protein